jgi:hypothetical protein
MMFKGLRKNSFDGAGFRYCQGYNDRITDLRFCQSLLTSHELDRSHVKIMFQVSVARISSG